MASIILNLWSRICSRQVPLSIMIIGLDNSGKTSLLNSIRDSTTTTTATASNSSKLRPRRRQTPSPKPTRQACDVRHQNASPSSMNKESIDEDNNNNNDDNDDDPLVGRLKFDNSLDSIGDKSCDPLNSHTNATNDTSNTRPTLGYNWERVNYKGHPLNVLDFSGQSRYRGLWQEFYNCVDAIIFVIDSSDLIRLVVVRDELENALNHPYFSTLSQKTTSENSPIESQARQLTPMSCSDLVQKQLFIRQGRLIQSPLADEMDVVTSPSGRSSSPASQAVRQSRCASSRRRSRVPILFLANKTDLSTSVDTDVVTKALNLSQLPTSRHPWTIRATSVNTGQGVGEALDWLLSQLLTSTAPTTTIKS